MRRRLTLAIVGSVVTTIALVGLGTALAAVASARSDSLQQLEDQAQAIGTVVAQVPLTRATDADPALRATRLRRLVGELHRDDVGLLLVRSGQGVLAQAPPAGIAVSDLDLDALAHGETISGTVKGRAFAATEVGNREQLGIVVIVAGDVGADFGPSLRWFLVASAITIVVGIAVALRLGRRLSRPVEQAEQTAHAIAAGDLGARVEISPGDQSGDELERLGRSINTMAEALQRSRDLEQTFLLSVSHDLRTPLTSIQGYAEAITDGAAGDDRAAARIVLSEAKRLERLVTDLLDLAKLDARQFSLDVFPVEVTDLVTASVDGFAQQASAAELDLTLDTGGAPITALVDPDRLAQVTANLVENAMKYARSRIEVVLEAQPGAVRLAVIDDGPGITDDDLPHVFERLYVSRRRAHRKESGSGLGLAIVRELVIAMNGRVWAGQGRTGGTALVVELPLAASDTDWPAHTPTR